MVIRIIFRFAAEILTGWQQPCASISDSRRSLEMNQRAFYLVIIGLKGYTHEREYYNVEVRKTIIIDSLNLGNITRVPLCEDYLVCKIYVAFYTYTVRIITKIDRLY